MTDQATPRTAAGRETLEAVHHLLDGGEDDAWRHLIQRIEAEAATPPAASAEGLDAERIEQALIEWRHRGHRIDSNGYCDDCMRFVDTQAAEDAGEIVEADARLAAGAKATGSADREGE